MLIITNEQISAMEKVAVRNFESDMVRHLKEFAPYHSEALGEGGIRSVIQFGVSRASRYGFTNRGPVQFYIELIFLFGAEFDTDPMLPWTRELSKTVSDADQISKANRLYSLVTHYLEQVAGPDNKYAKRALRAAYNQRFEDLSIPESVFVPTIAQRLRDGYPERCAYAGTQALLALIYRGTEAAKSYAPGSQQAPSLFVELMFSLGHGFDKDPHLPWVALTLSKSMRGSNMDGVERLYKRTMTYLAHTLSHIGA